MAGSSRLGMDTTGFIRNSSNYEELNLIGNGAYGTVYKARDRTNNLIVALKKVRVSLTEDGIPMSTLREISLLKQLDTFEHPNIVRLLDICHGKRLEKEQQLILYLVFEHVDQDLASYMQNCTTGLRNMRIKEIMQEVFSGVDFLHSHRIVHRDLKPQNLLVTHNGHIKLADFGLAKTYDFEMRLTSVVVTLWYRSPEVLLGLPYATSVDIWSCGCIMAELFRLTPLFCGTSEGDQLDRIFQIIGTPLESDWPENVSIMWNCFEPRRGIALKQIIPHLCDNSEDVLMKMLKFHPKDRISTTAALNHPYFTEEPMPS
ncbi:Cyclin-dependent kinase 4 [Carabus blaptoides fortunei]